MTFTLWPAIDLKAGKCVRLLHGDMEKATVYGDDPAAQAKAFEEAGFSHLHVVDLDGAFAGKPENADAVEDIIRTTKAKVEVGGGIRSLETVERWLSLGVRRVIIGTAGSRFSSATFTPTAECGQRISPVALAISAMVAEVSSSDARPERKRS